LEDLNIKSPLDMIEEVKVQADRNGSDILSKQRDK
jgi:hypothetical protein